MSMSRSIRRACAVSSMAGADAPTRATCQFPPSFENAGLRDLRRWRRGHGNFRIDLAHHAIAAMPLGGIEAGVGAFDQRLDGVALVQRGDADRDRHTAEMLAGGTLHQFFGHYRAADVI